MTTLYDKARWVLSRVGKTANDSFTFIIENPPAAWSDFITYVNNHRTKFGIACALIIGSVLIIVVTLPVGLVLAGPILDSITVAWQSSVRAVLTNTLFAMLQPLGTAGYFTAVGPGLTRGGVVPSSMLALGWCNRGLEGKRADLCAEGSRRVKELQGLKRSKL